jgi:oligopeptide/dipeptide ABC transporter ATP-binding protein
MRQRILISIALSCDPVLLIADEPTTSLDVTIQAQILKLITELQKERNFSVLFITHDLAVIAELCHKVGVMYAGNIVESADINTMLKNPLHPYTNGLLKCFPRLDETTEEFKTIPGSVPNPLHLPVGCKFYPRCSASMDICKKQKPDFLWVEPGHWVSCHLFKEANK